MTAITATKKYITGAEDLPAFKPKPGDLCEGIYNKMVARMEEDRAVKNVCCYSQQRSETTTANYMKKSSRLRLLLKRRKTKPLDFSSDIDTSQKRESQFSEQKDAIQQLSINRQIEAETDFRNEFSGAIDLLLKETPELAFKLCMDFWQNNERQYLQKIHSNSFNDMLSELLHASDFNRLIKFADFLLRDKRVPEAIIEGIIVVFQKGYSSHHVIRTGNIIKIVIPSSPEDAYGQEQNFRDLYGRQISNASAYLDRALDNLLEGRHLESMRESIHALENSVCSLDSKSKNQTLSKSLRSLEKGDIFNDISLSSLIQSLWDFANNTPGIRHGNKDPSKFEATEEQARLIFSLVAAWCAYLDSHNFTKI